MLRLLLSFFMLMLGASSWALNRSSNILDLSDLLSSPNQYFAVKDVQTGHISYTRDASFLKKKGYFYLGNTRLQGYAIVSQLTQDACTLIDIKTPDDELPAQATTLIELNINLDPTSVAPTIPFDKTNTRSFNYVVNGTLFDKYAITHPVALYYVRSVKDTYTWNIYIFDEMQRIAVGSVSFSPVGTLQTVTGLDQISFIPKNTTDTQTFKINLTATMVSGASSVISIQPDGHTPADAIEEKVDKNGYISESYSNGMNVTFAKIGVFVR